MWWSPGALVLSLEGVASPVAVDIDFEDRRVMDETIDGGQGHGRIGEDLAPLAEWLVGGDEGGASFVAGADELEQDGGFGLVLADVGEVVEDEQMEAVEPVDGGLECEFAERPGVFGRGRWSG
jgi:hypothetical protein